MEAHTYKEPYLLPIVHMVKFAPILGKKIIVNSKVMKVYK